ncbi:hypothetical protein ACW7EJ_17310, partial [Acinetobacter soli]
EILLNEIGDDPVEFVKLIAKETDYEPKSKTLGGRVWWKQIATDGDYVESCCSTRIGFMCFETVRIKSVFFIIHLD